MVIRLQARSPRRQGSGARDFSVVLSVETSTLAHTASSPAGTGGSFPQGMDE
jgi:hypothetical protein